MCISHIQSRAGNRMINQNRDNRYIAYCGHDCTLCPHFGHDCKDGCLGIIFSKNCEKCLLRLCNKKHGIANCARCEEFPCQKMEMQYYKMTTEGYSEWASAARRVLVEIRRSPSILHIKKNSK